MSGRFRCSIVVLLCTPPQLVRELENRSAHGGQFCLEEQFIIKPRRQAVPAAYLDDREHVSFLLKLLVTKTKRPHHLDASNLKPREIISVVHNTHLVCFGIAHAYACGELHIC